MKDSEQREREERGEEKPCPEVAYLFFPSMALGSLPG